MMRCKRENYSGTWIVDKNAITAPKPVPIAPAEKTVLRDSGKETALNKLEADVKKPNSKSDKTCCTYNSPSNPPTKNPEITKVANLIFLLAVSDKETAKDSFLSSELTSIG